MLGLEILATPNPGALKSEEDYATVTRLVAQVHKSRAQKCVKMLWPTDWQLSLEVVFERLEEPF